MSEKIPEEDLLDEIRRLADGEDAPTIHELREDGEFGHSVFYSRFGSWSNAVEEAGFAARSVGAQPVPKEDILADINTGRDFLGVWPNSRAYNELGEHHMETVLGHYDSWSDAIEAAKEYRSEKWDPLTEDDLAGVMGDV